MRSSNKSTAIISAATILVGGCTASATRPTRPEPWSALTSPTAAMSIVFSDVCMTAVRDGSSIEALALDHWLRPVSPASTGSPTATAAWRLASYSNVFVMALPDGGCSASVEAGDPQALQDAAAALTTRHGVFIRGQTVVGDDNHRTAWCTGEAQRPLIAVLVRRTNGRRAAFVANVFRAERDRPGFCAPAPG